MALQYFARLTLQEEHANLLVHTATSIHFINYFVNDEVGNNN